MDPLAQLNDISLGDPIGLWPLALGWWIVIICTVLIILSAVYIWKKHKLFNAVRRQAIIEIKALQHGNTASSCKHTAINQILKRCAVHYFDETSVNKLHGKAWQDWLSQQLAAKHRTRFESDILPLTESLYTPQAGSPELNNDATCAALLWLSKAHFKQGTSTTEVNLSRGAHV